jgi:hypothetical protein
MSFFKKAIAGFKSKSTTFHLIVGMFFVALNAVSNSIQQQMSNHISLFGAIFEISPSVRSLISGYGEAYTGTVALTLFLCIIQLRWKLIFAILFLTGFFWESLQYIAVIPGHGDYFGDLTAYILGIATGIGIDYFLKK